MHHRRSAATDASTPVPREISGAILFAILGVIGGINHQDAEFRVPAAILIGAGIGALYGAFRTRSVQKVVVLRPASVTPNQG